MVRPTTDDQFVTRNKMYQGLVWAMGGRVAEAIVFDDITTGASGDIQDATRNAKNMVTRFGFSEELGPVLYAGSEEVFLGRDYGHANTFAESTAAKIDSEVKKLIEKAYKECEELLRTHMDQLTELSEYLIENEKIDGENFDLLMEGKLNWRKTGDKLKKEISDDEATGELPVITTENAPEKTAPEGNETTEE